MYIDVAVRRQKNFVGKYSTSLMSKLDFPLTQSIGNDRTNSVILCTSALFGLYAWITS